MYFNFRVCEVRFFIFYSPNTHTKEAPIVDHKKGGGVLKLIYETSPIRLELGQIGSDPVRTLNNTRHIFIIIFSESEAMSNLIQQAPILFGLSRYSRSSMDQIRHR